MNCIDPAPQLEVRDLRLVLALAETGTTARAGELLDLAQPSVSRALLALEGRLGLELFSRTPRGLVPTGATEKILAAAPTLLAELHGLESALREDAQPKRLKIVSECYAAYHWVPSAIATLRDNGFAHAGLSLALEHTRTALQAVKCGDVDVALLTSPIRSDESVAVEELFEDEILFLVGRTHPLGERATLTPQDLLDHPLFVARSTPQEDEWFMRSIFGRSRPRLDVTIVPMTEALVDLARAGLGIVAITEWAAIQSLPADELTLLRLRSGPLRRRWRLAWQRKIGPRLGQTLAQLLREQLQRYRPSNGRE
ncbi:MAG: LysR family transcriptional regulator [Myxococcota bacterium]